MHSFSTEAGLIAGIRAADRKAQEHLFRSYYSPFLKICLRYAADIQEANSLLNDAFYKIYTKISSYSGAGSFEGWMRQIVVNTCLTAVRNGVKRRAIIVELPEDGTVTDKSGDDHATNSALSNLGYKDLLALIHTMPPVSRTVFNLFVFDGFSHREIAEQLGISEGTSYWHLNAARKWIKSGLKSTHHG